MIDNEILAPNTKGLRGQNTLGRFSIFYKGDSPSFTKEVLLHLLQRKYFTIFYKGDSSPSFTKETTFVTWFASHYAPSNKESTLKGKNKLNTFF